MLFTLKTQASYTISTNTEIRVMRHKGSWNVQAHRAVGSNGKILFLHNYRFRLWHPSDQIFGECDLWIVLSEQGQVLSKAPFRQEALAALP